MLQVVLSGDTDQCIGHHWSADNSLLREMWGLESSAGHLLVLSVPGVGAVSAASAASAGYKYLRPAGPVQSSSDCPRVHSDHMMATVSLYNNFDLFHKAGGVKRKWEGEEEEVRGSPDQLVPHFSPEKKIKSEFPFSNLMRSMAAKYQPPAPAAASPPLIMSLFSPINNPYSRLMAAMAEMSQPKPSSTSAAPAPAPAGGQPLDLSKAPEEKEIDVVSTDEEETEENIHPRDWDYKQVKSFIKTLPACEDFADVFEAEKISGSRLVSLSVPQLVQCLGIPLAQSIRIISIVRKLDN